MPQVTTNEPATSIARAPMCDSDESLRRPQDAALGSFRILRLVVKVGECNSAYNQFTLPLCGQYKTTICTFYKTEMPVVDHVRVVNGDGSIRGFLRNVNGVLNCEHFDVIHAHSPHVASLFLLTNLFRRGRMARTMMTAHNSYQNFKRRNRFLLIAPFLCFRRVICCGTAAADSFPAFYRWLAGPRLRSVVNGVNLQRIAESLCFDPADDGDGRSDDKFQVVCVGRLVAIKSPLTVLQAYQQLAGQTGQLTFLGEGNLRQVVEDEVERLNVLGEVQLPGVIPRDELFRRMRHADVFISASQGEGMPVAVLEAMACGCPIILSDIPPHREIAEGADFIPLVPVNDVAVFTQELQRFQDMSVEERSAIGERCRQLVEQKFSLKAMHCGYDRLYTELGRGHGG